MFRCHSDIGGIVTGSLPMNPAAEANGNIVDPFRHHRPFRAPGRVAATRQWAPAPRPSAARATPGLLPLRRLAEPTLTSPNRPTPSAQRRIQIEIRRLAGRPRLCEIKTGNPKSAQDEIANRLGDWRLRFKHVSHGRRTSLNLMKSRFPSESNTPFSTNERTR